MGKNIFNSVKMNRPKRNSFDLTHDVKLSLNMGELIPIMCTEAVPGDKFHISADSLLRFAPLVSPVMHQMDVTMHYFAVPLRLLWSNWEKFITQTKVGSTVPAFPTVKVGGSSPGYTRLMDYMGLPDPTGKGGFEEVVSGMPFAAYQMIYNEYYRDQNLIPEIPFALADGDNSGNTDLFDLRLRAYMHDYFTAALPFAQKGAAVDLPLGTVELKDDWAASGLTPEFVLPSNAPTAGDLSQDNSGLDGKILGSTFPTTPTAYDPQGTLEIQPTTVNDLRRAMKLQTWLEKNARGGTRYIEHILAHFGVKSSDKRLQRPEYITGVKSPVVISEVLSTAEVDNTLPQANMAGHGVSVTTGKMGTYFCEEHCYIIGIMSVMPRTAYQDGIPKHFLKTGDAFQYFYNDFANIGEQQIENREIFAFEDKIIGDAPFGYIPRYGEYKFENSRVAGDFRTSLDFWHLGRKFANLPGLNKQFIEMNPTEAERIFAVTDPTVQKLYAHVLNKVSASRLMPKYGTPSF